MIEFYLKNNKKNIKPLIAQLLEELSDIFNIENIKIIEPQDDLFPNLKGFVPVSTIQKVNAYYHTILQNKEKHPFLKNYINKSKIIIPKSNTFIDLFAGCGGLSIGLENAGFHPVFVNEIDPTFAETYYFNHALNADQYFVGDINELINNLNNYAEYFNNTTLVCGGPPCQGFSMANRQRLIDDPRNVLYKSYLKFLQYTRPKFFILENVKGMSQKILEIIDDFKNHLGDEYNFDYALLNAKDFGIPQNRERFFLIGNRIGVDTKKIFEDIQGEKKQLFILKDALENLPALQPKRIKNANKINNNEYGYEIRKIKLTENQFSNYINSRKNVEYLLNHKNRYNNERDIEIFKRLPQGGNSLHPSIKDIMPYSSRNHMFKDKFYKLKESEVCKTITSHMKFDCNMYIHPNQSRGLSPREAARVQTFPDYFFFRGSQNKWYAQIGNAVPVKLAEIIGNSIKKFI